MTERLTERLTKNTNVLSWDCGLSNLAYCLVEDVNTAENEVKIRMWENFSLNTLNISQAVENLVTALDERPWMLHVDHVCIESQLQLNTTMKALSHCIQTYFVTKSKSTAIKKSSVATLTTRSGPRVHFVAPQSKFKVCSVPEPDTGGPGHNRNKKVAIAMAKKILKKERDHTSLTYLKSHKKMDDLADSFLQGTYFLRSLRKKKQNNRSIQKHLGVVNEIVIREENDDSAKNELFVYKSEGFVVPTFDIDSSSVNNSVKYSKSSKDE